MKRSDKDPSPRRSGDNADPEADEFVPLPAEASASAKVDATDTREDDREIDSPEASAAVPESAAQLAEQREKYLRLAAEYDNFRKRTTRERQEAAQRGQSDVIRGLIDALDDLSRFAHVDPATTDTKTVVEGAAMVERKMLKTLTSLGLEIVNPVDQSFDPASMEAVATEPALSPEDDHVVSRVFQVGYRFNGQLLRPARVVVKQWNG